MKRTKKAGPNYNVYGWIFISLAFLLYIIFTIYPAIDSLLLAFQSFEGGKYAFVGLKNFKRMFGDAIFLKSLGNTGNFRCALSVSAGFHLGTRRYYYRNDLALDRL